MAGRVLLLETSSRAGEVAIGEGERLVGLRSLAPSRRNASDLAPVVDELLKVAGWRPGELTGVVVSLGPGSFTSLRVGLMSAKALAYAVGCEFYGIGTFEIIAEQALVAKGELFVLSDALQGTVYSAGYRREAEKWVVSMPLAIRPLDSFLESIAADAVLTGPGVDSYASRIPPDRKCEQKEDRSPRSATMLKMLGDAERFLCDPWLTEPIYLRGSSAEEKRLRHPSGGR